MTHMGPGSLHDHWTEVLSDSTHSMQICPDTPLKYEQNSGASAHKLFCTRYVLQSQLF